MNGDGTRYVSRRSVVLVISVAAAVVAVSTYWRFHQNRKGRSFAQPTMCEVIKNLRLIAHPEGGYFREIHRSGGVPMKSKGKTDFEGDVMSTGVGQRNVLAYIYYLIEERQGLVCNISDHVHYHHGGCTAIYHIFNPKTGEYEKHRLGTCYQKGDKPQVVVKGVYWKAVMLEKRFEKDYCILGEAVAPGFDFRDFEFVSKDKLRKTLANNKKNLKFLENFCMRDVGDTDAFYEKDDVTDSSLEESTPNSEKYKNHPQANLAQKPPKVAIGGETPSLKPPAAFSRIDRDNVEATPTGAQDF